MSQEHVATGYVKAGRLVVRNKPAFDEAFATWRDGDVVVRVERVVATRSVEQNALYWAAYIAPISEATGYTELELHRLFKKTYLPAVEPRRITVCDENGEVVLEDELPEEPTTTDKDKHQFSDYLNEITRFAAEKLKMQIPAPRDRVDGWR